MGRVIEFSTKANNKPKGTASIAGRARDAGVAAAKAAAASSAAQAAAAAAQSAAQTAAQTAATAAQAAAQGMNSAAQTAAAGVSQSAKQGVYNARGWAAPRLESAADYVTATAAPAVSSALRSTAQQVRPPDPRRRRFRSALTWSLLGTAIAAALGAAGVMIRQRYQAAMAADTEVDEAGETSASGDAAKTDSAPGAGTGTDAGVNGRVSASGW
jgi:trimeric autotransporter adhesin